MSATSGIGPSKELVAAFAEAAESNSIRFLKVSIQNETLILDTSIPVSGSFKEDLAILQSNDILLPDFPAYILGRLDNPGEWIALYYVPDNAKVRDKMLYASTRASLLKSLGSALFTDTIFATVKADLTADAYLAHQRHLAAPKPLSSREQELSDLRIAENATADYSGSRGRVNHLGTGVGLNWSPEAEQAVAELAQNEGTGIVILSIETPAETLVVKHTGPASIADLPSSIPSSEPSFSLFSWIHSNSKREIVFIYSCPSDSPIKHRMIYSSGSTSTYQAAKTIISASSTTVSLAHRKLETSDPAELDETFLVSELAGNDGNSGTTSSATPANKQLFAKPRGPANRRR